MPWLRARRLGGRLRWLAPALLRDPAELAEACPLPTDQPALLSLVLLVPSRGHLTRGLARAPPGLAGASAGAPLGLKELRALQAPPAPRAR